MQDARAHYIRRHKTTKSKGIGMSTRTAIETRFLYVLIFLVRKFEYDFVVRYRLKSFFSVRSIIRLRNDEDISLRIAKLGTVRQKSNPASVG